MAFFPKNRKSLMKIFRNLLDVKIEDNGIIPLRFTDFQLSAYSHDSAIRVRSYCPAGICIDFITDSRFLKLNVSISETSRDFAYFDLYVDDCFIETVGIEPAANTRRELLFNLSGRDGKEQRVTLYLPHTVVVHIDSIEYGDNSVIKEVRHHKKNLLCMGDSITQGMTARRPSSSYPVQLARCLGMNLINQGVGSYVFDSRCLDLQMPFNPGVITVAYGVNDWYLYDSIEFFRQKCRGFMELLTEFYPDSEKYVILPIWKSGLDEVRGIGTLEAVRTEIDMICRGFKNMYTVDGFRLVPNMPEFLFDGIHPNDEGFMHYSINLASEIIKRQTVMP